MQRFEGKTVIVTGAGSGIGAACVRRLHDEGATVVAVDLSQAGLQALSSEMGESTRVIGTVLDVSDRDAVATCVSELHERLGALHGLINCAGIPGVGSIFNTEPELYQKVMSVNLEGTINMCQAFVNRVKDAPYPRAIVNTSSGAGVMGHPDRIPYVASKFAVSGITRGMCEELGPFGIRINAVAPGVTNTPLVGHIMTDEDAIARVNAMHPIGRVGEPSEIAAVMVFLLTEDASFMTGAVVSVDGGQTACL